MEAAIGEPLGKRAGTLGTLPKETKALKDVWQKENQELQQGKKSAEEGRNGLRAKADSMEQAKELYVEQIKTLQGEKSRAEQKHDEIRNEVMTLRLAQEQQTKELKDLRKQEQEA
ncbi:uncharacterized protein N0V89_012087 [Didymosphaeria variabile]|uniref:Uncharacterized protein n=1 Tax=Didymosphaeria variabile TaxID=1932322 RepID=A0A9W8XB98_9PLEO|nr:uncharacterized protein N0V89_012087 [Didymosphaeria variabile]KAJ4345951.1 hypothetical protein N0V89_012087 [Didymosphaeria variabile]